MSRYVERAEHVSRILKINANLLMDVGELEPEMLDDQWKSVLRIVGVTDLPAGPGMMGERVARHLTFDETNPNSVVMCLEKARENARSVRSEISAEMWEHLNQMYWTLESGEARQRFDEQPEEFYNAIMLGSMLFQGLTDQTLTHDQRWMFSQLSKSLERVDITCRILDVKFDALSLAEDLLEDSLWNIQWMSVLRMCCSIEAYRRQFLGDLDPAKIASFLILEDSFPRSIRYNVEAALESICHIRKVTSPNSLDPAEKILGKLAARLEYAEPADILQGGVRPYLAEIRTEALQASAIVQQTYFLK